MTWTLTVPGQPHPAQRPRRVKRGRGFRWLTPDETLEAEARVAEAFRAAHPGAVPLSGPVAVVVMFYRWRSLRVDLDNLAKTVLDGLTGVAWSDDSQVSSLTVAKALGVPLEQARTEVAILSVESAILEPLTMKGTPHE